MDEYLDRENKWNEYLVTPSFSQLQEKYVSIDNNRIIVFQQEIERILAMIKEVVELIEEVKMINHL